MRVSIHTSFQVESSLLPHGLFPSSTSASVSFPYVAPFSGAIVRIAVIVEAFLEDFARFLSTCHGLLSSTEMKKTLHQTASELIASDMPKIFKKQIETRSNFSQVSRLKCHLRAHVYIYI